MDTTFKLTIYTEPIPKARARTCVRNGRVMSFTPKATAGVEPMLEPVDLKDYMRGFGRFQTSTAIDWVIAGPETGPRARPTNIDWVRDLSNQCTAASVPFFDKKDVLGETIQEFPR